MFSRREEINNIMNFGAMTIIRAMLESMSLCDVQRIRMQLDPHWSDGASFDLDKYFTAHSCKLCSEPALSRKQHFHEQCAVVRTCRKQSESIEEFEEKLWYRITSTKSI